MRFLLALTFLLSAFCSNAQDDTSIPPYKRYPTIPGLQLLTLDSTTYTKADIPKKKPLLVMVFSPDCDHCQHEAEQIAANKAAFSDVQIVMASTYPLHRLKTFSDTYGLTGMKNVVVTKDPYYLLPSFYSVRNFPYLALYNKKGDLITTFEGSVGIDKLLSLLKAAK